MGRQERPPDGDYFEQLRTPLLCEGDIFADVPRTYPGVAERVTTAESGEPRRFILSGPLEPGFAMLITPSCSMGGRVEEVGPGELVAVGYDHLVRALAPIIPMSEFQTQLTASELGLARKYDALINYMYIPAHAPSRMPASLALLYMPISLDHDLLLSAATRTVQLSSIAGQQLRRKLVALAGGIEIDRQVFDPPRD